MFQYPSKWGTVSAGPGNRYKEGNISCISASDGGPLSLRDSNSVPLYDNLFSFSHAPTVQITVLSFTPSSSSVLLCHTENSTVNLQEDKDDIAKLADGDGVTTNPYGIKMASYPTPVFIDEGSETTPWEPVYVYQFYRFYGGNERMEGLISYTLNSKSLAVSGCVMRPDLTREECAHQWLETSNEANDIRSSLMEFDRVMRSFRF
jgi:hypothetical protein